MFSEKVGHNIFFISRSVTEVMMYGLGYSPHHPAGHYV